MNDESKDCDVHRSWFSPTARRFAVIVTALIILVGLAVFFMPTLHWSGGVPVEFRFRITDSAGAGPVSDARIRVGPESLLAHVSDPDFATKFRNLTTDEDGRASTAVSCSAGGSSGPFGRKGHFGIHYDLLVEADGYRPLSSSLSNVVSGGNWPISKRSFDIELVLVRDPVAPDT